MPTYGFACAACGPFEQWVDHRDAGQAMACPACAAPASRVYGAPYVRSRSGPFASAGPAVRSRVERARTGEPVVRERLPAGRDLSGLAHGGHGHAHASHHPWAIGH
jgi:putative FmdB family regulatory protein